MTALYRIRIVLFLFLLPKKGKEIKPISEESLNQCRPLIRLVVGVFFAGWVLSLTYFPALPINIPPRLKALPLILALARVVLLLSFPNLGITAHPKRTSTHTYISRK
jgi:hypothetical protein